MSNGRPTGMLMTGAVGSILNAVAWLIFIGSAMTLAGMLMGGGSAGMSSSSATGFGGLMLIAVLFILGGSICQGVGFLGLQKVLGGMNKLAGIFSLVYGISILLAIVTMMFQAFTVGQYLTYLMFIAFLLVSIFAGLSFLSAKNTASSGSGPLFIGAIAFLVSGVCWVLLIVFGLLKINVGMTVVKILLYGGIFGILIAHIITTLVMLGQRKGGGEAPAAPAAD